MWWQYTITFVGSLTVVLISFWISQWWLSKRDYTRALRNLRNELSTNIKAANLISQWADMNVDSFKRGQIVVAPCPRFYDSVWIAVKGSIAKRDDHITAGLEDAYLVTVAVNDLLHTIDCLKWEIGGNLPNIEKRISLMLDAAKQIINNILLPMLENGKKLLDENLK